MSKASFDINALGDDHGPIGPGQCLLELSEGCLTALWYSKAETRFYRLVQFPLSKGREIAVPDQLREIFAEETWFQQPVSTITVVYHTGQAQLLPEAMALPELQQPLLDYLLGVEAGKLTITEKDAVRKTATVYRIPREIQDFFQNVFPAGTYWHYYTLLQRSIRDGIESGIVYNLDFCSDKFTLAITLNGVLHFLQDQGFDQPEDISWYLLGLTEQSGYDRDEVRLVVGGLIDSRSVLFQELEKYFLQLELRETPAAFTGEAALDAYPPHYFSPILNLALCV